MREGRLKGLRNRLFQELAKALPGARTMRVKLHRWRGVNIGKNVWIGYDTILETSQPHVINIHDNVVISVRAMLIGHFREIEGITIDEDAFIGPGAIILPGVTIGKGAVVTAGSIVTSSVPPNTVVQGNPARVIAKCDLNLTGKGTLEQFYRSLTPVKGPAVASASIQR